MKIPLEVDTGNEEIRELVRLVRHNDDDRQNVNRLCRVRFCYRVELEMNAVQRPTHFYK